MQKLHTLLAWLILLLLIVHLILGSVTLLTPLFLLQTPFASFFLARVCVHAVLALVKVFCRGGFRARAAYPGENARYWLRIASGAAILALVWVHRVLWTVSTPFGVLPRAFEWPSLLAQLLLTATLAVHCLLNLRPLLLDSGLDGGGRLAKLLRLLAVLLALLAFGGAAGYYFLGANYL